MGTKTNPGRFDCYAAAAPDEPLFVLLGRDRHAALLVSLWAHLREMEGEDPAKVAEARACAAAMSAYATGLGKKVLLDLVDRRGMARKARRRRVTLPLGQVGDLVEHLNSGGKIRVRATVPAKALRSRA